MSMSGLKELSKLLHAQKDFSSHRLNDVASCHLSTSSHPIPQASKNQPNGTKIILPLQAHMKRTFKHDSVPTTSSVKKLRLLLKAESDQRDSSAEHGKRRPHARIRIRKSLLPNSIKDEVNSHSSDKIGTKETAHLMVKWALQNTPYLVGNFEIRSSNIILV